MKPDERVIRTDLGLLIRAVQRRDGGLYYCTAQEHTFTRTLLKVALKVIDPAQHAAAPHPAEPRDPAQEARQRYKDYLRLAGGAAGGAADRYCETMWLRERRQRQKAKWKHAQELKKMRNRRHRPAAAPLS